MSQTYENLLSRLRGLVSPQLTRPISSHSFSLLSSLSTLSNRLKLAETKREAELIMDVPHFTPDQLLERLDQKLTSQPLKDELKIATYVYAFTAGEYREDEESVASFLKRGGGKPALMKWVKEEEEEEEVPEDKWAWGEDLEEEGGGGGGKNAKAGGGGGRGGRGRGRGGEEGV